MAGQRHRRIALVTPKVDVVSETFIRSQIRGLQPELVLHGGFLPIFYREAPYTDAEEKRIGPASGPGDMLSDAPGQVSSVASLLKEKSIDIVLAQYGPTGAEMLMACREAGIPLVVHFHGYDASQQAALIRYGAAYRELFPYCKAVIVVSKPMAAKLERIGCPGEKLVLNPYGVQASFFQVIPQEDSGDFIFVGRFVEKKGPDLTIRAFHILARKYPSAKLVMAGSGPLLESCKALVSALGLTGRVLFPGALPNAMVPAFMQKGFAYVQHSRIADNGDSEGAPVSIMEAAAASLPVVSTRHAGIPDIVDDGITGWLVEESDVEAMADAMGKLWENRDMARQMGRMGREKALMSFTMDRYIETIRKLLNS